MAVPSGGWVMWAGTVGFSTPVLERLDAAGTVDVKRFSVTPPDVESAAGEGVTAADLGRRIRDRGYDIIMDPLVNWYGGMPHPGSRFGRFSTDEILRMCADLGVASVNLIGQPTHDASLDRLASSFADICDKAGDLGAQAHLEFMPISAIATLAAGWDIVRTADHPNGGLCFDTWHFFRSDPDFGLLETIPGERIFSVQVSDAGPDPLPDVREDTMNRRLPGDGVFDLVGVISVLHRIGALTWVGPEVITPALAAMPPTMSAQLADARVREVVAAASG